LYGYDNTGAGMSDSLISPDNVMPMSIIEPHDGHIERVTVSSDRSARIEFDKLIIYHPVSSDRDEVWIHKASLRLLEINKLSWQGLHSTDDDIYDAVVYNDDGIVQWTALLQPQRASRLLVTFSSGATLDLNCAGAHLELLGRVRYIEDWIEPPRD
jgi:hypothetical protein